MKSRTLPGNVLPGVPGDIPTVMPLKGFVGPSTPETLRLYWDLTLTRYWEIPRNMILSQVSGNGPNDPVTILVPTATPIITANRMPAEAVVVHRALIDGNIPFEGPGIGPGHRPLPGLPTAISAASDAGNAVLDYMSRACLRGSAHMCVGLGGAMAVDRLTK